MNADELFKHAPSLLTGAAALAGSLKITELSKAILGPATAEFGELIRDKIRVRRFARQLQCLQRAEEMVRQAGYQPRAVPLKTLFPLLEAASLEEEEDIQGMWASLLAHASDPELGDAVLPSFVSTLKGLSMQEVLILNDAFDKLHGAEDYWNVQIRRDLVAAKCFGTDALTSEPASRRRVLLYFESLVRSGLIRSDGSVFVFTEFGHSLVYFCRPPGLRASKRSETPSGYRDGK